MEAHVLFNQIQSGEITVDEALYPGKQIGEFQPEDLLLKALPSGFSDFDKAFVLKQSRGELIIIGARPSHGKSAMLFQIATNIAKFGKSHIFSLEMDHDSIVTRQVAAITNRGVDAVQMGIHINEIQKAKDYLDTLDCHIDDTSGLTIDEICYRARMEHKRKPSTAIFIDYIQIIKTGKGHSRATELATVSSMLKELAKELRIPVIVASQLNRNNEYRDDKTPQLSDLKESGALEQDADVVVLLYRDRATPKEAKVIIAKNRNGPTGEITMEYAPAQTRFLDSGI